MTRDINRLRLCFRPSLAAVIAVALLVAGCGTRRNGPELARGTRTAIPVLGTPGRPVDAAPASPAAGGSSEKAPETTPSYSFSVGDEFDLRVPDAPQFDQTLKVRPDGKFSLALLGTVQALGRTPEQVEADLRQRMQKLSGAGTPQEYVLQPNDEIELKFPYLASMNEVVKLRPDGKLQLQMIGTVQAAGLTPEALREALQQRYARVLRSPEVAVVLRTATTQNVRVAGGMARAGLANLQPTVIARTTQVQQVFIGGEVLRPGVLVWRPGLTVIQAVAESGWYLPSAEISQLLVIRRNADNQADVLRPDLGYGLSREQKADVALQPFDIVILPKTSAASLADTLNQYVFNLLPPLRNSSLGFSYVLRGDRITN